MYNYIKGIATEISPKKIVIENNGIGYEIITPNPYHFNSGQSYRIETYYHVREDAITLFGFESSEAKSLFVSLLSVKGIGPKSALAILATGYPKDIVNAIDNGDSKFLSRFPGIGPKASQQIILDLKGKISFEESENINSNSNIREAREALESLGYKAKEIDKVIKTLDSNDTTEDLIRKALTALLK
jgi:Holliday junction DNA helicase RuvA